MLPKILMACSALLLLNGNSETNGAPSQKEERMLSAPANNRLSDQEKKDGWQLLFDGTSLNGWHKYGGNPAGKSWIIDNGAIRLDATKKAEWQSRDGGDIVSDKEYGDFDLQLDWKIDTAGNSGIIFYIHEDSTKYEYCWSTGPEMQVLDNERHPDSKIIKHRAGDLYDLISSSKETVKPALEWNHAEIKCINGKLNLYLNGENVVSTMMWTDDWKKLVAGSKFHDMADFGTFTKGRIGLQDHGANVWFRNIKIKEM